MTNHVLILDDNPDNRELLFLALSSDDYNIYQCETHQDAHQHIMSNRVDVALLDIELPDGDGLEIAATMRQQHPASVIIMLSALDNFEMIHKASDIGVNAYIVKPYDLAILLDLIAKIKAAEITATTKTKIMRVR